MFIYGFFIEWQHLTCNSGCSIKLCSKTMDHRDVFNAVPSEDHGQPVLVLACDYPGDLGIHMDVTLPCL